MTVNSFKWKRWGGKEEMPPDVEPTDEVLVRYRDLETDSGLASEFHWERKPMNSISIFDIVNYIKTADIEE